MKRGKRPQDKEGALLPKRGVVALATEGFNLSHPLYRPLRGNSPDETGEMSVRTKGGRRCRSGVVAIATEGDKFETNPFYRPFGYSWRPLSGKLSDEALYATDD